MRRVVVGSGTVLADDPQLTVRDADGSPARAQPLRVVVGHRDVPSGFALDVPDELHLRTHDPDAVLAALHDRGVVDVLLEGGPRLAAAFVARTWSTGCSRTSHRRCWAPGRRAARRGGGNDRRLARLQVDEVRRVGVDVLVDARPERAVNGAGPARAGPRIGVRRAGDGREPAARGDAARGHAAERGGEVFTGIVEEIGEVVAVRRTDDGAGAHGPRSDGVADARHGDSIAVNGVCLTVTAVEPPGERRWRRGRRRRPRRRCGGGAFRVELVPETLARTSLADVRTGTRSTSNVPSRWPPASAATSCRATSTASARLLRRDAGRRSWELSLQPAAAARPVRRREGVDHRRRGLADRRRHRRCDSFAVA